jgi:ribosome biogenesis GTPase A
MQNKQIQWFPGHMFKSLREIKERVKLMDIVLVLLDSRLPESSMNPELFQIVKHKPMILVFNKMDLADDAILNQYLLYYQNKGFHTIKIDAQSGKNVDKIHDLAKTVLKEKLEREQRKGMKDRPLRTMILGIPNVGKSTLINQIAKRSAAKTANIPGVTKAQQWIKLGDRFELLDTPGVLWPKFEDPKVGYHLALTGAIKDQILPDDDVIFYALSFLKTNYPYRLKERYNISIDLEVSEMLDHIAKLRGCLNKGAQIDYERVYKIILTDIRNKDLGGLSFDRFEDVLNREQTL